MYSLRVRFFMSLESHLNNCLRNLVFHFFENSFEQQLKVGRYPRVFFDPMAGGVVAGGSGKWISEKHLNNGIHEPATIAALVCIEKVLPRTIETIFDVGALYGYFSLISKSIFSEAEVLGFEMNPESYSTFQRNILRNKHLGIPAVRCLNMGLSDTATLQKPVHIDKFKLREDCEESNFSASIDILSIDDFCRISSFRPDLIKIDVEGYQAKILPGALNSIKDCRPIILLEFDSPVTLKYFNTTNKEVVKPIFELGYACYWCNDQRMLGGKFEKLDYQSFSEKNEVNSLAVFVPS